MSLLHMSILGGIMILVIATIRALWLNRLPKKMFFILWGIVCIRLLIPYRLPSVFSIDSLIWRNESNTKITNVLSGGLSTADMGQAELMETAVSNMQSDVKWSVWRIIWITGTFLCLLFFLISYLKCIKEFQTALPVGHKRALQWIQEHPLKRPLAIRQLKGILAPLTYGVLHPVILMPETTDWEDTKQLPYVLEHEFIHIQRWDAITKIVLIGVLCIHWFNPLVWLMFFLFNRDMELACDESVVRHFGEEMKSAYAHLLIRMEETKSGLTPLCNNFSKNAIEERITAIMKIKKASVFAWIPAVILIVGITVAFSTSNHTGGQGTILYISDKEDKENISEEEKQRQLFREYEKYGITKQNDYLYYKGELIRYFLDGYEWEGGGVVSRYSYYNEEGTIDVHTVFHDTQNEDGSTELFGKIVDIQPYSQEEFEARDFSKPKNEAEATAVETGEAAGTVTYETAYLIETADDETTVASEAVAESMGGHSKGKSFQEIFSAYKDYGIAYEEPEDGSIGNVYWEGELVKQFIDVSKQGTFSFESSDGGDIIVQTVYDKNGKLTGLEKH